MRYKVAMMGGFILRGLFANVRPTSLLLKRKQPLPLLGCHQFLNLRFCAKRKRQREEGFAD